MRAARRGARFGRRRGQAIVLGSIGLFIMALGVISTLNIGQAVRERIRLQNAADAAAYSLAAEEARLFNFFAFTNRAQVAHYSAAMTVQSYISYLTYVGAMWGSIRDLIWDAASIYQCICDLDIDYPPISPPYCILAEITAIVGDLVAVIFVEPISIVLETFDEVAAEAAEALGLLNRAVWRAQLQQGLMINLLLTSGGYPFVEANAPNVDFGLVNGFNALFNQLEFNLVFDRGAGINFSLIGLVSHPSDIVSPRIHDEDNTDDDVEAARQVMTEIANASRWGTSGGDVRDHFVTDRSDAPPPTHDGLAGYGLIAGMGAPHMGQTRLVGPGEGGDEVELGVPIEEIRQDDYMNGSVLAADDYLDSDRWGNVSFALYTAGQARHLGAAVIADSEGGGHFGYNHTDQVAWESGTCRFPPPISMLVNIYGNFLETMCGATCCSEDEETFPDDDSDDYEDHSEGLGDEGIHQWPGITAFPKFNPDPDETRDYHQPSTWILLNLPPENFNRFGSSRGQRPWSFDFSMTLGTRTVSLDTTPGVGDSALLPFLTGLNALSRGQAYYHRPRPAGEDEPSNWQEHPNFFNPYWHARLAPVGQKLKQVYDRLVSREMHADADTHPVLAGGLNLVRNLMGDTFFHVVTSVMTH